MPVAEDFIRPCGLCQMLGHDCQACARRRGEVKKIIDGDTIAQGKLFVNDYEKKTFET